MPEMPYGQFCTESDAADQRRGVVVPVENLPGLHDGRAKLQRALKLLSDPATPGALDDARQAVTDALDLIPQGRQDRHCHEFRWRTGMTVCSVRTCARCAPLRADRDRRRP